MASLRFRGYSWAMRAASALLLASSLAWTSTAGAAPLSDTAHSLRSQAGKPGLALTALVLTSRMMAYKSSHDAAAAVPGTMTTTAPHDADMLGRENDVKVNLTEFLSGSPSSTLPTLDASRLALAASVAGLSKIISQDPLPADAETADGYHRKALDAMYAADQAIANIEYARRAASPALAAMAADAEARYAVAMSNPKTTPVELKRLAAQAADLNRMQGSVDRGLAAAYKLGDEDSTVAAALVPDSTALALAAAVSAAVSDVQADIAAVQSKAVPDASLAAALGYSRKTLNRGMREWSTIGGNYIPATDEGGLLPKGDRHSAVAVTTADRDMIAALAALNQVAQVTR